MPYDTKEEILKLGEPDPELVAFLKDNPLPPVDYNSIDSFAALSERRTALLKDRLGSCPPTIHKSEITYPTRDGLQQRALLYQPTTTRSSTNGFTLTKLTSPLIILIHGGGWCVGVPENEEQTSRNLVHAFNAVCVSISYRLAPAHPFPTAVNDAWDAVQYFSKNATTLLEADPSAGFVVGGSSAGANLSAIVALKARDSGLVPKLTGSWLAIPAVCPKDKFPEKYQKYMYSYEQNATAPVLPTDAVEMFTKAYNPDFDDGENFAVLNHPRGHKGLPKTFFQIDGMDVLRDEGLVYERVLREEAGVETRLETYPGLPHGHWSFFPMLKGSDTFRRQQVEGFAWLLGRKAHWDLVQIDAKPTFT